MSLRDFFHVIRKYIALIVVLPILFGAITGGYLWGIVSDVYSSSGMMTFVGITNNENGAEKATGSVTSLKAIIDSESFHNEVLKKLNIPESDNYQIYAAIQGSTNMIKVIAEGPDPRVCTDIANTTMNLALERSIASYGEGSTSIMTPAVLPDRPVAPHRIRYLLAAIIGGLLIAVCIALIIDAFRSRWQTAYKVESLLRIPVLAECPHGIVKLAQEIQYASLDKPARTIVFLSATKDEGCSQVAREFALDQAGRGKKTLLVSPDDTKRGLYGILVAADSLEACVENEKGNGYDTLALETSVQSSGSAFASEAFQNVLENQIIATYDSIIFDAPALNPVPNSVSLAAVCDATILVVNKRQTDDELLAESLRYLKSGGADVFGVALVN